jgi:propionyl-CoA carboxylase alpha chain
MPPITKLLVANRGEIALRIFRTAREMDIGTVAVYSDPDAGAPFVLAADEAVRLPGAAPAETYLSSKAIIEAAQMTGAQAIHPGYGFLSENAAFARACAQAGLIFVGPSPEAIEAMGSKVAAKEMMAAAGVPVLPGVTIDADAEAEPGKLAAAADEIGYPVLVKAAFGGGGRGMRIVSGPDGLAEAVAAARREAASAFGDPTVFLERFVERPRHIEVQIIGDCYGTVAHLFERECSIQRRYQKIIEEAPSPAVDDALRERLAAAAVAAGQAIRYKGAGTVEFVLGADAAFHFLEMNTRLQVEHPVTEMITGLDLVALQIAVAEGKPLPPEVTGARIRGHAIEARLYAEDPAAGFRPATGTLCAFDLPAGQGLRVDAGVTAGSVISAHYDPMLAKVIAHAPDRELACRRLARALAGARVHGVATNVRLLAGILREQEFLDGQIDTGYLERHDPAVLAAPPGGEALALHAAAAALAAQARRRSRASVLPGIPSGYRNVPNAPQQATYRHDGGEIEVRYAFGRRGLSVAVAGRDLGALVLHRAAPDEVDITVAGVRRRIRVHRAGDVDYVDSALGSSVLAEVERFPVPGQAAEPGSLLAPMPGTVVRVEAEPGQQVAPGTVVVVIEAMKMEHPIRAPEGGVVAEVAVRAGQTVDTGAQLARVDPGEANPLRTDPPGAESAGPGSSTNGESGTGPAGLAAAGRGQP